jgi:hypothetical protein
MCRIHARTEWVPEEVFQFCKATGARVYHSSAPKAEFKNEWDKCIPLCSLGVIIN